ncbi:hypothetical protein E8E12_002339 [Didymella heteroderae]|uniref:3'-phosphate/5'-hydroxy nucleic acid ligase n=1 Tax=Didymella heteroderae TaxID=1769908 RepID=A0A9P4WVA5_9PLEO|nr:hypothetical protein E8E12_002339 [Didymella heteroderae]
MATRVTIANNAQQTQKAPLLVPGSADADPAAAKSIRSLVFKTAQAKLKLKKPLRVFVKQTGQELVSECDWVHNVKNDVVLLVSAGEEYVGVKKEGTLHKDVNLNCPIELLTSKAAVEALAITQLTTTAHTLPGIIHAVGQPDLHPGTKFPIGAVFIAETLRGLEGPWKTQEGRELWLVDEQGSCAAGEQWDRSVGTIGAGNHFAEVQVVEEASEELDGLKEGDVVLLVHSGSRGYGGSVLKMFSSGDKVSLEEGSAEAEEYLKDHEKACRWARANRDLIAMRFLACLEPGNEDWRLALPDVETTSINAASIERSRGALNARKVVDIWHNNVERVPWPPTHPSSSAPTLDEVTAELTLNNVSKPQKHVFIHRKGCAPTYNPSTEQPLALLPLPGSRGTPTLILSPTFSTSTSWGLENALSLAHGAGRSMSRAKVLTSLSQKYKG